MEKQMTNNNIWDCADMQPMISAKWSIDPLFFFLDSDSPFNCLNDSVKFCYYT
jgi:hypothetical protein